MVQSLQVGDFLVFQLEAGFGLLRLLAVDEDAEGKLTWHLVAYNDLFPDVDTADASTQQPEKLSVAIAHAALTNRAFESTQVAKVSNIPLTPGELEPFSSWLASADRHVSDRSIRLLLGLR